MIKLNPINPRSRASYPLRYLVDNIRTQLTNNHLDYSINRKVWTRFGDEIGKTIVWEISDNIRFHVLMNGILNDDDM